MSVVHSLTRNDRNLWVDPTAMSMSSFGRAIASLHAPRALKAWEAVIDRSVGDRTRVTLRREPDGPLRDDGDLQRNAETVFFSLKYHKCFPIMAVILLNWLHVAPNYIC